MSTGEGTLRAATTLGAAVGVFGVSFGVVATSADIPVPMACALSLLVFTGATQFAAVTVVASGGSALAAVGSGLLLGLRHIGYGLALDRRLPRSLTRRLLSAQFLIDESTAMATAQADDRLAERAFWATGLAVFVCWNVGTLAGAIFGSVIGHPETLGLDAIFPAAFLALVAPLLRRRDGRVAVLAGGAIAAVLVPLAPAGVPVVVAAAGAVPAVLLRGRAAGEAAP